jgi:hypothetical protein
METRESYAVTGCFGGTEHILKDHKEVENEMEETYA